MGLTIIIPTLNEAVCLPETLRQIGETWPEAEVVVCDGNSSDETAVLAEAAGARVLKLKEPNRGRQLGMAGASATGDWMLFLHADTLVSPAAGRVADAFCTRPESRIATFQVNFDSRHWLLRKSAWWTRFDSVFTRFGDQGILVRTSYYLELGGFQPWPLFEDVDLLRRARRQQRVEILPAEVTTSARRFRAQGAIVQQIRNAWLLLQFLAGGDPHRLAKSYPSIDKLNAPSND